ncbi:MAG: hypothetical protein Q7U41_02830 [Microbacterium sp.]|nr:hypothetical protein [Microbacterium sp.]
MDPVHSPGRLRAEEDSKSDARIEPTEPTGPMAHNSFTSAPARPADRVIAVTDSSRACGLQELCA